MNNTSFAVGVVLDGKSVGVVKAAAEAKKALEDVTGTSVKGSKETAQAYKAAAAAGRSEFTRMAQARETLGIRSERRIQQEIRATEAAYRRLTSSGSLSWDEQRRAAARMREEVLRLNNEMGRFSARQRAASAFRGIGLAGAGLAAGAAVVARPLAKAIGWDDRMADMANTAFAERTTAGRIAGMKELSMQVREAARFGGGTLDNSAETLDTLLASGAFSPDRTKTILREAVLAGTANRAQATDFATMAITANKTMGIKPEQMGRIFGMATYAGQQGGFEVRDMAKWLPQQMAAAKAVGLYGEAGFAKLAAVNQAAVNTAGTRDEAGNNVVNLLAKIGSADTQKDFKKLGVNLPKALAEGRMKGMDAFDVVGGLLDAQLKKDRNYQAVQKRLKSATGADRQSALEAVGNIAQGTVIGKVFQDRQALMALFGYMQERGRVNEIAAGAMGNTDAAQRNMEVKRSTAAFSVQQTQNSYEIANQDAMTGLTPAFKVLTDRTVDLMQKYPDYTAIIVGTTTALTALAAAAGAAALASTFLAGGKGGRLGGLPGAPGPATATRGLGTFGRLLGGAATLAGPLMLLEALSGPSDDDIAKLREMDRRNSGYRGKGFADPRILGRVPTLGERLGGPPGQPYMPADPLRGEILVRVTSAPGLTVEAETKSNSPRISMRASQGETNGEMRR